MTDITILDGGMSRELIRLGAELRQPEWSALAVMESPGIVQQVHEEFIAAGSNVVTTNSYALVPFHIGEERFWKEGAALIALSGKLARAAVENHPDKKVKVAASLPPIFGSYEPDLFKPDDAPRYLKVLVDNLMPYADIWLGETLSLIAEGQAVCDAVKGAAKPVWISFTLADGDAACNGDTPKLRGGETVEEAARWAISAGISGLLFNCSRPEVMRRAIETAKSVFQAKGAEIAIGVYANALEGQADDEGANAKLHGTREDLQGEAYSRFACEWAEAGASMIGGCCGIGAEHINCVSNRLVRHPVMSPT